MLGEVEYKVRTLEIRGESLYGKCTHTRAHTHTHTHTHNIHIYMNKESCVTIVKINSELASVLIVKG